MYKGFLFFLCENAESFLWGVELGCGLVLIDKIFNYLYIKTIEVYAMSAFR